MITMTIKKLDGTILDHGNFNTVEEGDAWFKPFIDKRVYGSSESSYERLVTEFVPSVLEEQEVLDEQGLSLDPKQFVMVEIQAEIPSVWETVIVPAEHLIEVEDVTLQVEQSFINSEALKYLSSTDWYVTRFAETGVEIPEHIADARETARSKVVR